MSLDKHILSDHVDIQPRRFTPSFLSLGLCSLESSLLRLTL